jgi:two-component system CheB/CheR fusion protein
MDDRDTDIGDTPPLAPAEPSIPAGVTLAVGLGASAGGLESFRAFFANMPADTGMAFVLVQHLDPDHVSALVDILRGGTAMAVSQAEDGDALVPNHIFVIPPDATMTLVGGVLKVTRRAGVAARRASVDTFLISLAEDQGENAVGIILSGFGSDGARGVEAIKEHGGLTLAQAEFDHAPKVGMPASATSSGFVDNVLSVETMPAALIDHWRYRAKTDGAKGPDGVRLDVGDHLGAICAVLNSRLGRDFSQYKPNTLMRRVQRRMQILQVEDVPSYLEQLRERPDEPELLFREVLIRVTQFFRDRPAFDSLATQIPAMLTTVAQQETVRIWVPGCATGEEAYSIAILFREALALADRPRKVQIFATDIDDKAIEIARAGLYPGAIAADLSPALLERYFQKEGEHYRVSKDIREMCLFSTHDLVKDPPFSRLDLISCRNLLIYFGPVLQKRVIAMFHYGLQADGLLLLGSSEAVTAHAALFAPIDKKARLYKRREAASQLLALSSTERATPRRMKAPIEGGPGEVDPRIARVVARYTPAFVVIDHRQNVKQFSGPIGKYLEPASGAVSLNLSVLIHAELRGPLQSALKQVAATGRRALVDALVVHIADQREAVNLVVEPLGEGEDYDGRLMLVAFQDLGVRLASSPLPPTDRDSGSMAEDLAVARERLQTLAEELETSNEELQSANEELQSSNEELETSKEELQSINEELATLNAELNARNDLLVDLNSDLTNLIDSTSIATLFLDRDMRIRRFTPATLEIFNVREGDQGRPITDIVSHLAKGGLYEDVKTVLRTLIPVQREVTLQSGNRVFQMEVRPYRGSNNVINGVVVTFVDVSERTQAEFAKSYLAAIIDSSDDAIIGEDLNGRVTSWNTGAQRLYGYSGEEAVGRLLAELVVAPGHEDRDIDLIEQIRGGGRIEPFDTVSRRRDGSLLDSSMSLSAVRDDAGEIIGVSRIIRDASKRLQADAEKALLLGELDHRVKNILAVVASIVSQTLRSATSPEAFVESMEGRIKALTQSHSLLTQDGGSKAALAAILHTELAPYDDGASRVTIDGPNIVLTPRAGLAIAMAIHELTTNAAKYGALSVAAGRISVTWSVATASPAKLRLVWTESEGPPVAPPTRKGFGTVLIERSLVYEFDGEVERTFTSEGMRCVIELPLNGEVGRLDDLDTDGRVQ